MAAADLIAAEGVCRRFGGRRSLQATAAVLCLLIWEALSASGWFYRGALPSSVLILEAFITTLLTAAFWSNLSVTVSEVAAAVIIGGSVGIACGLALSASRWLGAAFLPYVNYLASSPKIIFLPVLLSLFGIGLSSKVASGAIACFFPLALSTVAGVRGINPVLTAVANSFGATPWQIFRKVYLRSLIGPILTGMRIALGVGITVCILAEIRVSREGIGFMVMQSYQHARFVEMYALLVVTLMLAAMGNSAWDKVARKLRVH